MENKDFYDYLNKLGQLMLVVNEDIKKITGLTGLEAKLLNQIKEMNCVASASTLAKINNVTIAAIMHCLANLEKEKYIFKTVNEDDNRQKLYHLTKLGLEKEIIISGIIKTMTNDYLCYLNEDEEAFKRIVIKTIKYIEKDGKND